MAMNKASKDRETTSQLVTVKSVYLDRRARMAHPAGKFDTGGRWFPSDGEYQPCCYAIRSPSRSFPYSLMVHCRSLRHVARLYNVDEQKLRLSIKLERYKS